LWPIFLSINLESPLYPQLQVLFSVSVFVFVAVYLFRTASISPALVQCVVWCRGQQQYDCCCEVTHLLQNCALVGSFRDVLDREVLEEALQHAFLYDALHCDLSTADADEDA